MNKYDLFDALGGVDEDLLERSERKAHRRLSLRKAFIAAAAVMMMVVTAMATPAIRELIFAKGSELVSGGFYITLEKLGIIDSYVPASYEVDVEVPYTPDIPEYIQDFRLPTYFTENGWTMYLEISRATNTDTMAACFYSPGSETPNAAFRQYALVPSDDDSSVWVQHFSLTSYSDVDLTEATVRIGDQEATLYDGHTVIWSDGQYAYELVFHYDVAYTEIEQAVLSMASINLQDHPHTVLSNQLTDDYKKPIETFYSLGKIPEGFTLTMREWNVNNAAEWYMLDNKHFIVLNQCVVQSEDNLGPVFSVEGTLLGMAMDQRVFTTEEYMVDKVEVTIIREESGGPQVMWNLDEYCFSLDFSYDPGLTDEELLEYYRSVQPMPDFTDNLTE